MNDVAERYNRTIVEATSTCLIDARLPNEFWGEIMTALSNVRNRIPDYKIKSDVPYHRWFKKNLSLRFLKRLASLAIIRKNDLNFSKLNTKGVKGILVGYAKTTSGYRVWNPELDQVVKT